MMSLLKIHNFCKKWRKEISECLKDELQMLRYLKRTYLPGPKYKKFK